MLDTIFFFFFSFLSDRPTPSLTLRSTFSPLKHTHLVEERKKKKKRGGGGGGNTQERKHYLVLL